MHEASQSGPRTWLITGVSSGFGREIAEAALAQGDTVVGTLRRPEQGADFEALAPGRARALILDVCVADDIVPTVAKAAAVTGRIDVLVNNAGYGFVGAVEEASDEEVRRQFDTNFFGTQRVTRAVLPYMREQQSGHIINMSSAAGFIASPGLGYYSASKFAVEGLTEALAGEVAKLGIRVTLIEPGGFRTRFSGGSFAQAAQRLEAYDGNAGRMRDNFERFDGQQPGDPAKAAAVVLQLVEMAEPPLRMVLGSDVLPRIRDKLNGVLAELERWEALSLSTDHG